MAVNVFWKKLWEVLKNDPLYSRKGFASRCIEELEKGAPAEYQYLDGIEGPQAYLLHLLCDVGDLARLDKGEGKRDDAEHFDYDPMPNIHYPHFSAFWEPQIEIDYRRFSAFAGSPIYMVDIEALKVLLRAERLPLPDEYFDSEPDTTDKIEELYREKFGNRPIYLDDVREIMTKECGGVDDPSVSSKMKKLARKARELTDAGKDQVAVHYEIYGPSSADPPNKDRQVRKLLQIERELSVRK